MTTDVAPPAAPPQLAITAHLSKAGVTKAAIIDDAFDPPRRDDLEAEIGDFWNAIERDPAKLEELRKVVPDIADSTGLTDEALGELWKRRDELPALAEPLRTELFDNRLSNLKALDKLSALLREAGIEPVRFGSQADLLEPFKLVFIDWLLGLGENASQIAKERASKLYDQYEASSDKPFIVLMSSKAAEAAAAKEHFREASNLLGGLFDFVPKDDLEDRAKLHLHLATWALGLPTRHDIQHFVEALETGVKKAVEDFIRRVRSLRFEDYANIQWLSLQTEGHPLGDYMLWLYKSYLGHLLHSHPLVRTQQQHLDGMTFESFTPVDSKPSADLADIYHCALTEPAVQEVGPHPRAGANSGEPYLQLGDLFFKDPGGEVLMVANAACDLAYAPGAARKFPADRPVLLLHGRLQRYEDLDASDSVRTELVKHDNRPYRILWDPRHATTQEYGKVAAWLSAQGYIRKARLALPYALEVQQAFATRLMRIGMPVRPPTYRHADVEIFCKGENGDCHQVGETVRGGAVVIRRRSTQEGGRDEDVFVLTLDCMSRMVSGLDSVVTLREKEKGICTANLAACGSDRGAQKKAQGELTGVEGMLKKLQRLKDPSQEWLSATKKPAALPEPTKREELHKELLWVYRERKFEGLFKEGPPIVLNLRLHDHADGTLIVPSPVIPALVVETVTEPGQPANTSAAPFDGVRPAEDAAQAAPDATSSNGSNS